MDQNKNECASLLSQPQRNSLATILQFIEESLHTINLQLREGDFDGIIYSVKIDLTKSQQQAILDSAAQITQKIQVLKDQFNLPQKTRKMSKQLMGLSSYSWSALIDKKSDKLRRYGTVPEQLKDELDGHIDELIRLVNQLSIILQK